MFYVGGHVSVQTILMVESTPTGHAAGLINVAVILEKKIPQPQVACTGACKPCRSIHPAAHLCAGELEDSMADGEAHDDFEAEEALEDEEDVKVLGGEGFSPEEIAAAETRFTAQLVSQPGHGCFTLYEFETLQMCVFSFSSS